MNDLVKYSDFIEKRDKLQKIKEEEPEYVNTTPVSFEEIVGIFSGAFTKGCPECNRKDGKVHPLSFDMNSWDRETFNMAITCSNCHGKAKAAVIKKQVYQVSKEKARKNLKDFALFIHDNFKDICGEIEGDKRQIT